jgi:class 3 adenylate cyclase
MSPVTRAQPAEVPTPRLTTVAFVDIVGSTPLAARIGDERWADLLERFQALVRLELANAGGLEMDTAGDGFFVVFTDPAAASSGAPRQGRRPLGLRVRGTTPARAGLPARVQWSHGEHRRADRGRADPDEVLVSSAVEELLAGDARFAFPEARRSSRGRSRAVVAVPGRPRPRRRHARSP